ncbi:MAG TPA: TIGR03086 family metal-binding protein [Jatrophihabitans sp.]|nr:TIGR03086 family metal-binding protein [Jatrophihabitans sp.]
MDTRLLARATGDFAAVLAAVSDRQAGRPTPCAGWTVGELVEHVIAESYAFGGAVASTAGDRAAGPAPAGGWPAAYRAAAEYLLARFAELTDGDRDRPVAVAGLPGARPAAELYEMQIADTLIHTWDLATAVGARFAPDAGVLELALRRMRQVPEQARGGGRPFAPAVPAGRDADPLDLVLRLSGRDPNHPIHP